ncbi:MAG: thioredoxin [Pyrinomonadaceae bacterium]
MAIMACANCGAKNRVDESAVQQRGKQPVCGKCGTLLDMKANAVGGVETGTPRIVTDAGFAREVLGEQGGRPVLVDMWAAWCAPCRMIAPVLEQLAAEANGRYVIAKMNVDENPQTAARFSVQSIPTLLVFKNGALVDRLVGAQPKQVIAARLQQWRN